MTIEEAIRILDPETTAEALAEVEYYGGFRGNEALVKACEDACIVAVDALKRTRWIPCSERMPKVCKDTSYLSYIFNFDIVDIADYHPDVDEWTFMGLPITVTHWMPLPEFREEDRRSDT